MLNGKELNMEEKNVNPTTEETKTEETAAVKAEVKSEKPNPEIEKLKAALSKANSEAAEYKRALREKQTEAERAEAERAEADKAKNERLAALEKQVAVTEYTNKCLALDFDPDLAARTANAIASGDFPAVFDCLKAFVDATKTKLTNEALNKQPALSAGAPPTTNTTADKETADIRRWMGAPNR